MGEGRRRYINIEEGRRMYRRRQKKLEEDRE